MELMEFATSQIAAGHRWRIGSDGTAINLHGSNPTDTVRACHWDACPARQAPVHSKPLLELWQQRARHSAP
jgi:hypothetical protein